jgi:APA family basic amino acid/polyamine antiporter
MLLSSVATGLALFVLRWRKPDLPRPYRTLGYPVIPLLFISFYIFIGSKIISERPLTSVVGLLVTFSGLPFYFVWEKMNKLHTYSHKG